jgi:uncharacterized membrane protein
MPNRNTSNFLRRLFRVSLALKAVDGVLETAGGILLAIFNRGTLNHMVIALTQHELTEDPKDFVANHLRSLVGHLTSDVKLFAVAYLLIHGLLKVALAINLLKGRTWVYPWAMGFFSLFMAYEAYRLSYAHSLAMACFFSLDLAIVALLYWEHRLETR